MKNIFIMVLMAVTLVACGDYNEFALFASGSDADASIQLKKPGVGIDNPESCNIVIVFGKPWADSNQKIWLKAILDPASCTAVKAVSIKTTFESNQ